MREMVDAMARIEIESDILGWSKQIVVAGLSWSCFLSGQVPHNEQSSSPKAKTKTKMVADDSGRVLLPFWRTWSKFSAVVRSKAHLPT
jgi:hypothetical protein